MHLVKTVLVGMGLASGLNHQTLGSALETSLINYLCERPAEDKGNVSLFMIVSRKSLIWFMYCFSDD